MNYLRIWKLQFWKRPSGNPISRLQKLQFLKCVPTYRECDFELMLKYQLIRGETVLGIVTRDPSESDFPWQVGWLEPSAAYDEVRLLFEAMERILEVDGFNEASGNIHDHIMAPSVVMRSLENGETTDVIGLTIADKRVSWR